MYLPKVKPMYKKIKCYQHYSNIFYIPLFISDVKNNLIKILFGIFQLLIDEILIF